MVKLYPALIWCFGRRIRTAVSSRTYGALPSPKARPFAVEHCFNVLSIGFRHDTESPKFMILTLENASLSEACRNDKFAETFLGETSAVAHEQVTLLDRPSVPKEHV